ncbi:hypothetical protein WICMUC_003704 [Wickerhamomyces mucosus]|uniref:XPA C-terminal domain-containing protein n=1 Tax=Wickerhamomyces mucosus TaxID=1378264 RepID=A0A9P8PL01_9ASCO|nr:hypothetical protein WICMUC_003704 [Wickerhamomyces mucosus]
MPLTAEQQAKIEENRRKALAKLKERGIDTSKLEHRVSKPTINQKSSTGKFNLTEEQRRKIEENREKALQKLKEKQQNFRNASTNENSSLKTSNNSNDYKIKPTIKSSTYIDYDLSTMKDTKGGFISNDVKDSKNSNEKTFDEWKLEQSIIRDLPPPMDINRANKCFECGTFEIDVKFFEIFKAKVCKKCQKKIPEKYSLLTKTECREDYYLTEPELKDLSILPRLEKPNPYGTYSRMQLFLRYQVEEFAFRKWGGEEGLDLEWQRREEFKIKRRDKKYEEKLKEMRKKTRAEEFNRRIRNGKFDDHIHEFSQGVDAGINEDGLKLIKRRCIQCGFETFEALI